MIWIALAGFWGIGLLFIVSLCRAAARGDEMVARWLLGDEEEES